MIKKIMAGIAIAGLIAGSGCGVAYGIKYHQANKQLQEQESQDTSSLVKSIEELQNTIKNLNADKEQLNAQLASLQNQNIGLNAQIASLEELKKSNEKSIAELTNANAVNEETINGLNSQITSLQAQKAALEKSNEDKSEDIEKLNAQITNLQNLSRQLQTTNEINNDTITSLNNQIVSLNEQISSLTLQLGNNSDIVNGLQDKINQLEKSVAYYEQYIAQLESETQVAATFEYNGSVHQIIILTKGQTVSVTPPADTNNIIFNGWTVDGEAVDLATYPINTNTTFVADLTYKYDVIFKVDGEEYNSQYVVKNGVLETPSAPAKEGYEFLGWTTNGVDLIDISAPITANTTYIAKFVKVHTVTYVVGENSYTEKVKNGMFAQGVEFSVPTDKVFKGWLYGDNLVDIKTYTIVADITFVAKLNNIYTLTFYNEDNTIFETTKVEEGQLISSIPTPTKTDYTFKGWSIDKTNIIDLSSFTITNNNNFYPIFVINSIKINYNGTLNLSVENSKTIVKINDFISTLPSDYQDRTEIILTFTINKYRSVLTTSDSTQTIEKECSQKYTLSLQNINGTFEVKSSSFYNDIKYSDFVPSSGNEKYLLGGSKYSSLQSGSFNVNSITTENDAMTLDINKTYPMKFYDKSSNSTLAFKTATIQILELSLDSILLK